MTDTPPKLDPRVWRSIRRHILFTETCWVWTGPRIHNGYGSWGHQCAHRRLYEWLIAEVPKDLQLDHLCRNRICVNPSHLEPVTRAENQRRGVGIIAENLRKTTCPRGHPYDAICSRKGRICTICKRANHKAWSAKNAEKRRAYSREYYRKRKAG